MLKKLYRTGPWCPYMLAVFLKNVIPAIVTSPEFEGPLNSRRRRCVSVNTFRFAFRFWVQHKRKKCSFEVEWAEYQPDWRDLVDIEIVSSLSFPFCYLCLFLSLSSVFLSLSLTSTCLVTFLYLFLSVIQLLVTLYYLHYCLQSFFNLSHTVLSPWMSFSFKWTSLGLFVFVTLFETFSTDPKLQTSEAF